MRTSYLVAYEYGQGAVWAIVHADSEVQLRHDFPELTIVHDRPPWMTDAEFEKIRAVHDYDIDDRTFGLLAEIIEARRHGDE
jgi:hypothetical protein